MSINIFGVVGEDVRASDVIPQIQAEKGVIDVNIMSVGGDVREGLAIYDELRKASANGQEVNTFALGITASIASIIFMAGDVREVSDNAEIMVHNASAGICGNKHDLKEAVEFLDGVDDKLIAVYTDRTALSIEEVTGLVDQETFMSADEAVSKGFATAKTSALALVAILNKTKEPVNMAEEQKEEHKNMFNKFVSWLNSDVKAEAKAEAEAPEVKAEDEEEEEEKPDFEAENIALKAELADLKAKAEGDEEEKKEADAKAEEDKAKAEDEEEKEMEEAKAQNEAKAHLIFDAMTQDKITKAEAKNLITENMEFVSKTLDARAVNFTGGAKTESPEAKPTEDCKAIWKAMKSDGKHGEAQAYYKENRDQISKKEK